MSDSKPHWATVCIALISLLISALAYCRTVGDHFDISEGRLGLLNMLTHEWDIWQPNDDPVSIAPEQWNDSDPGGRFIQARVYNDGLENVHILAVGIVYKDGAKFLGFTRRQPAKVDAGGASNRIHCGKTPYSAKFYPCPDSLAPKQAQYVRINLDDRLLSYLQTEQRSKPLKLWFEIGSGSQYFDTNIALPLAAFTMKPRT